ncbi:MAG: ABC transporter permease [Lentisphaerae bacterium]|nr:ABC transporter permease [Lentisphaerota bacterium]
MHLPLDLFLALRYLRPKRTFVSLITLLSILGPTLGVAILLIVNSIMAGFGRDIQENIMNWQAHLHVFPAMGSNTIQDPGKIKDILEANGVKASPLIQDSALIQIRFKSHLGGKDENVIQPKVIYGIDPETEYHVTGVKDALLYGNFDIEEGEALVGDRFARSMGLTIGTTILIHSPARLTQNVKWEKDGQVKIEQPDEVYFPEQVKIAGIFSMGFADFDENVIFVRRDQAADLLGLDWGSATSVQGKVASPMQMDAIVAKLNEQLNGNSFFNMYRIVTWKERNQMLFGTLQVEQKLMAFLMTFILLVASFSIAATLITVVVQKTREIGTLKAVGISSWMVARIFVFQGAIIGFIGTTLGIVLGLTVLHYRDGIAAILSAILGHDVFPAELYHLNRLPALWTASDLVSVSILSMLVCISSALVPALFASALPPAKSLQDNN